MMEKMKIGVQLFSLRSKMKDAESYENGFARVKEMGAEVVQVSGGYRPTASELAVLSAKYQLPICITHSPFGRIVGELDKLAEEHLTFGCKNIGIGMMPKEFRTGKKDDLMRFIDILNSTADKLSKYGMTIAYHNHWFEFDLLENEVVYDIMIDKTIDSVQFIPDSFWIKVGGHSTEDYLKKLNGRVNTLHLKDYKKMLGIPVFRAVGKGDIDFKSLLSVAENTGVENAVVELDFSPKPFVSMDYSLKEIKGIYS